MKTQVAVAAVIAAAVAGGGAAAITTLSGHHGSPSAGPLVTVSLTPSTTPSTTPSSPAVSPTSTGSLAPRDPQSTSGIHCKWTDMWDSSWIFTRYPGPATADGDAGAIQMVQRMLNYVTPSKTCLRDDGTWTAETGDAIKAFQSAHGLEPVNQAGPKTFTALQIAVLDRIKGTGAVVYADPASTTVVGPDITSIATARAAVPGAAEDFITFIGNDGAKAAADAARDCKGEGGDSVQAYDPRGFALGGFTSCGGAAAIWSSRSGSWRLLLSSQAEWNCADLQRFNVPSRMYGALTQCLDGQHDRAYGQRG